MCLCHWRQLVQRTPAHQDAFGGGELEIAVDVEAIGPFRGAGIAAAPVIKGLNGGAISAKNPEIRRNNLTGRQRDSALKIARAEKFVPQFQERRRALRKTLQRQRGGLIGKAGSVVGAVGKGRSEGRDQEKTRKAKAKATESWSDQFLSAHRMPMRPLRGPERQPVLRG